LFSFGNKRQVSSALFEDAVFRLFFCGCLVVKLQLLASFFFCFASPVSRMCMVKLKGCEDFKKGYTISSSKTQRSHRSSKNKCILPPGALFVFLLYTLITRQTVVLRAKSQPATEMDASFSFFSLAAQRGRLNMNAYLEYTFIIIFLLIHLIQGKKDYTCHPSL
jgi:hypothetical protein